MNPILRCTHSGHLEDHFPIKTLMKSTMNPRIKMFLPRTSGDFRPSLIPKSMCFNGVGHSSTNWVNLAAFEDVSCSLSLFSQDASTRPRARPPTKQSRSVRWFFSVLSEPVAGWEMSIWKPQVVYFLSVLRFLNFKVVVGIFIFVGWDRWSPWEKFNMDTKTCYIGTCMCCETESIFSIHVESMWLVP